MHTKYSQKKYERVDKFISFSVIMTPYNIKKIGC